MTKLVIFGNSGSGKSTLAKQVAEQDSLAHLDLDTIAWKPISPPQRQALSESAKVIEQFVKEHSSWVIEGCYADLLELVLHHAEEVVFLNLPIELCIENAKQRPWEPHKYETKEAQDANLDMLIDWIKQYDVRSDTFSKAAHQALFDSFSGSKRMFVSNTRN